MIFCSKPQKFTWRNAITLLLLLTAGSILILLLIPSGSWFGSETDWYSQHVTIADYMRKNFYATGSLFPDFTGLGGGTNFFSLSYYGFMRPDVLISYLFPHVEMEWFIQGYAIFEILLGGGLLYYWLHRKGFSDFTSFACGFFYLSANCFFQAHRASEKCTRQNAEKTKMQNMVELYCGRVFCRIHESLSPASHWSCHPWK